MSGDAVRLIAPQALRPTEAVSRERVREVVAMIVARQAWTQPICLERTTLAILDGHHRHAAALRLGLRRVPVRMFEYESVTLASWRPELSPTRAEVLRRAAIGNLYPPKTTRHTFADQVCDAVYLEALLWGRRSARTTRRSWVEETRPDNRIVT